MKRSEMIKKIEDQLYAFSPGTTYEDRAKFLLSLIEEAGMEPPRMSLPTKAFLNKKVINVGNITTVRIWEPEDE